MKRLLKSSRFVVTVLGVLCSWVTMKWFDSETYALAILGVFTTMVLTTTVKDTAATMKGVEFKKEK